MLFRSNYLRSSNNNDDDPCSETLANLNVGDVCLYKKDGKIYAKLVVLDGVNKKFKDYKTLGDPSDMIIEDEESIPIPRDVLQDLINNNFINLDLNQTEITPEIIPSLGLFTNNANKDQLFTFLRDEQHSYELCNRSNVTQTNNYCNLDTLSKKDEICCEKELLEKIGRAHV